jgi:hypothetical protein
MRTPSRQQVEAVTIDDLRGTEEAAGPVWRIVGEWLRISPVIMGACGSNKSRWSRPQI